MILSMRNLPQLLQVSSSHPEDLLLRVKVTRAPPYFELVEWVSAVPLLLSPNSILT